MTKDCTILLAVLSLAFASCNTDRVQEDAASSAAVSALPVVAAGYGTAYAGKAGWQNTSIALNAPDVLFAEEIEYVPAPAFDPAYAKLPAFTDDYWYMGSKGDFNYLMHYPPLFGFSNVLKIKKSNYEISDPFPLTSRSKSWRRLNLSPQAFITENLELELGDDAFEFYLLLGKADPPLTDVLNALKIEAESDDLPGILLQPNIIIRETEVYDSELLQRAQQRQRYLLLDDEPAEPTVPRERD